MSQTDFGTLFVRGPHLKRKCSKLGGNRWPTYGSGRWRESGRVLLENDMTVGLKLSMSGGQLVPHRKVTTSGWRTTYSGWKDEVSGERVNPNQRTSHSDQGAVASNQRDYVSGGSVTASQKLAIPTGRSGGRVALSQKSGIEAVQFG